MTYSEDGVTLLTGHVLDVLASLPAESVDTVVTSPPYWSLRKYKAPDVTWPDGWVGQYGLEETPAAYVEHTIAVLRAVRRVLKPTGVCFWNIGDGYAASKPGRGSNGYDDPGWSNDHSRKPPDGLKPKDLVLMPERVALAAQADGWWVRSRIAWTKPNPMPESVRDRPTDGWEHIWMFTKAARYWWDAEAVREPHVRIWDPEKANGKTLGGGSTYTMEAGMPTAHPRQDVPIAPNPNGRNLRNVWEFPTAPFPAAHFATFPPELPERCIKAACPPDGTVLDCFAGSGTTLIVARQLGRRAIGIELSEEYAQMAIERLRYGTRGLVQLAHGQAPLPLEGETS